MLVEDLGPRTLGEWGRGRPWSELAGYFEHALGLGERISRLPAEGLAELNPILGRELLAASSRRPGTSSWSPGGW